MLLSEVIGQEPLKKQLVQMVQQQRLSHALLFVGPEGAGAWPEPPPRPQAPRKNGREL